MIITILLACVYIVVISCAVYLWHDEQKLGSDKKHCRKVSVIVIARNEAANIKSCLLSIANNDYPKDDYEIILMDDHSDDETIAIANGLNIKNLKILKLENYKIKRFGSSFKKAGQYWAIEQTQFDIILQTDGDCICPPTWISDMTSSLARHDVVTGPIIMNGEESFLSSWQMFDIIGTMVITHAGIRCGLWQSANAANMIYRKSVYQRFSHFINVAAASGDDIFFINWAYAQRYNIAYHRSKDSIVRASPETSLTALYHQRLRWASKTKSYNFIGLPILMSFFFIFHFSIVVIGLTTIFFYSELLYLFIIVLLVKWISDYILLRSCSSFFGVSYPLLLSPIFSLSHMLYVIVAGIVGTLFHQYQWKGRAVR